MENNLKPTDSQTPKEEPDGILQSYNIAGEIYQGYYSKDVRNFIIKNQNGKCVYNVVRDICPDEPTIEKMKGIVDYPNLYPHLLLPLGVCRDNSNTQEFMFFPYYENSSFEPLEEVLFGKNMSLSQRFTLSLSIATAVSELESVFTDLQIRQLRLDAFLVDMKKCMVYIDCKKLSESYTEEENDKEHKKMAELGLMPPEWYEDKTLSIITVSALRHLLAVCIFRFICAEDPFDGGYTLQNYPYRGTEALSQIYGKNAKYILMPNGQNSTNNYIGWRAYVIFNAISPSLQYLFYDAFVNGIQDPSKRPSAKAWTDNQKDMVSWFAISGREWRIANLKDGNGIFNDIEYLVINKNIIIPLINDKLLYQFMFNQENSPVPEKVVGKIQVNGFCKKLIFTDAKNSEILLHPGKNKLSETLTGIVTNAPWKMTVEEPRW